MDANMRELALSGFMSNRGRQNVASFLIHDLGLNWSCFQRKTQITFAPLCVFLAIDWRAGADYFESVLIDYDVCSNWGNWLAIAGLKGGRINRFNVYKQVIFVVLIKYISLFFTYIIHIISMPCELVVSSMLSVCLL